jgi:hypothetical protein
MPPPSKPPRSAATALDRLLARVSRGTPAWVIGALGVAGALFLARWLGARHPPRLQHYAPPAGTSTPPANVRSLLDDANVVFFGHDALPDGPTTDRLNRDFRQIRAYAASRRYLHR